MLFAEMQPIKERTGKVYCNFCGAAPFVPCTDSSGTIQEHHAMRELAARSIPPGEVDGDKEYAERIKAEYYAKKRVQ